MTGVQTCALPIYSSAFLKVHPKQTFNSSIWAAMTDHPLPALSLPCLGHDYFFFFQVVPRRPAVEISHGVMAVIPHLCHHGKWAHSTWHAPSDFMTRPHANPPLGGLLLGLGQLAMPCHPPGLGALRGLRMSFRHLSLTSFGEIGRAHV